MTILPDSPRDVRDVSWTEPSSHPKIPFELAYYFPKDFEPGCDELEQIWHDVVAELMDQKYRSRTHNSRRTREAGCSGPLCMKATRVYARQRRTSITPQPRYRWMDPLLDFFFEDAKRQIELHEEEMKRALSRLF